MQTDVRPTTRPSRASDVGAVNVDSDNSVPDKSLQQPKAPATALPPHGVATAVASLLQFMREVLTWLLNLIEFFCYFHLLDIHHLCTCTKYKVLF